MTLKTTLIKYRPSAIMGDGQEVSIAAAPPTSIDKKQLREDLRHVVGRADLFLWAYFAAVLILLAGSAWFVFENRGNPGSVSALFAADGISLATLLGLMRNLWREKFRTETLVALLPVLPDSELPKVINQLLSKVLSD